MAKRTGEPAARYLQPYMDAVAKHGSGFPSLLWASPGSQALRFEALTRLYDFSNKSIVDIGCGRADFLDYLLARKIEPNHYVGIEAVEEIAAAAERKRHKHCTILRGDFLTEPKRLFVGADIAICCGSLNTLSAEEFYQTIHRALDAAAEALAFNFLCSPELAQADFLSWHDADEVMRFLKTLSGRCEKINDYKEGDCTMIAWK